MTERDRILEATTAPTLAAFVWRVIQAVLIAAAGFGLGAGASWTALEQAARPPVIMEAPSAPTIPLFPPRSPTRMGI